MKVVKVGYMKKIVLIWLLINITNCLFSQILNGRVVDSDKNGLSFTSISIKGDSSKIIYLVSDESGFFSSKIISKGIYEVHFSRVNFMSTKKKINLQNDTFMNVEMCKDLKELKDVIVTSKKPIVERKADRYILNVMGNIITEGKKTLDILRMAPGLFVTNDNLSLVGKSGVLIYLNERLIRLSGEELSSYLNSIATEDIVSIEVIPVPPSNFEAGGDFGIVKITIKKSINPGIKGDLSSTYIQCSYPGLNASGNMDCNGKKIELYGSWYGYDLTYKNIANYTNYYPKAILYNYNPKKWNYTNLGTQIFIDYQIDSNRFVNFNYQATLLSKGLIKDIQNVMSYYNLNNILDSSLLTNGTTKQRANLQNFDIQYNQKISSKGASFKFECAYLYSQGWSSRPFNTQLIFNSTLNNLGDAKTEGKTKDNIYTSKVDITFPIKKMKMELGGKLSFIHNSPNSYFYTQLNGAYVLDSSQANIFEYKENTQAYYFSLDRTFKKWSLKSGIRSEITQTKSFSHSLGIDYKHTNTKIFPTLFVSYNLNEKNFFSFSYGSRINRPPYEFLDPFKWYINKYTYATGNPFLQPYYLYNFEFSYLRNYTFNFKIYNSFQPNQFGSIILLDSSIINKQIQTTDNFFDKRTTGFSVYKFYNKISWLETVLQINFSHEKYLSKNIALANKSGWGASFSWYNCFYVVKSKNIQIISMIEEELPGIYGYHNQKNKFNLAIGLTYIFPSKKWELNLYMSDIFKNSSPQYWYTTNGVKQVYNNYFDDRQLSFSIRYKFGNRLMKRKKDISSFSNEEEQNRIK